MDEQFNGEKRLHIMPPERIVQFGSVVLIMLALFLAAQSIKTFKEFHYIGSGVTATNTISVSGMGEVFAVPDRATFSVTVQEEAKDVATAQGAATKKSNDIIAYLKAQNVDEKDIKTIDYSVNPQYDYTSGACQPGGVCRPGTQTLRGYQVTQTLEVKVRDTKKAGDLLSGVGGKGASQVSGLSFTTDDPDALQAEARSKAIADAKTKADELAKELGVKIVRIVGFSEDGGGRPIYYAKTMSAGMGAMDSAAPVPELPVGQNKITSNVSVTYEIR